MALVKRHNKRGDITWYIRYTYQGKDKWEAIGPSKRRAELALAKRMSRSRDALGKKANSRVCQGDALSELYGEGWDSEKRFYAGIESVTREDVVGAANAIFSRPALPVLVRPAKHQ